MKNKIKQTLAAMRELESKLQTAAAEEREDLLKQYASLEREANRLKLEMELENSKREEVKKSANEQMREIVNAVRDHKLKGEFQIRQNTITSSVINSGELNNMTSAGLPLTINELINPLEMGLIYDKLGIKVATGVKGQIQWPCLDSYATVSVGGEKDSASQATLNFSKINANPVKVGIKFNVSNEAVNDEAFDLVGVVRAEINKALGRVLNTRILYLSTTKPSKEFFVGPLMKPNSGGTAMEAKAQTYSFTGSSNTTDFTTKEPTYKDLKKMKGKVLATGAEMSGFCYVMDAATYSFLEAQPKDTGSGRFIIEGGKLDGDPVFVTGEASYAKKIVAGCFAYVALNQHGDSHLIIDPYTAADTNEVRFVYNADFSITELVSAANTKGEPFVIGS